MALRVFYPSSQCVRIHPYWELVDDFFLPGSQVRSCRRKEIDEGWNRILQELFQFENSPGNKRKPDNPSEKKDDKFIYNLDFSGFQPENIKVKTIGQKLIVEANQEETKEEDGCKSFSKRQIHKTINLPENVQPETVTSLLNRNGVLRITAPVMSLPAPEEKEMDIQIEPEKEKTKDQQEEENKDETN